MRLILADARSIPLEDQSVQCCVTSPPYWGLRDYGNPDQLGLEPTPEEYVANMVQVFREVRRVLKDDGTLWLNLGDSYANSAAGRTQGGFNARYFDRPEWNDGKQDAAAATKPTRSVPHGLKPKDLVGIPWRVAFALQADGWYLRSDIIWSKPNPMPESVTDRPTKSHEYVFLLSKGPRYYFDADAVAEPASMDSGFAKQRLAGRANWSKQTQNTTGRASMAGQVTGNEGANVLWRDNGLRNIRTVWEIATRPYPEAHFATFPEALARRCILAGCPEGGTVLDPFCGSGTALLVCQKNGRRGIGLDISAEYLALAAKRDLGGTQKSIFSLTDVGES